MSKFEEMLRDIYERIDEEHRVLLMNWLEGPDTSFRSRALGKLCPYLPESRLWELSGDPSPAVRKRLVTCADKRGISELLEGLAEDPHPSVRAQVARRCADRTLLRGLSRDGSPRVRRAALLKAVLLGRDAMAEMVEDLLDDPSSRVRTLALELKRALDEVVFDPRVFPVSVARKLVELGFKPIGEGSLEKWLDFITDCEELERLLSKLDLNGISDRETEGLSKAFLRLFPSCEEVIKGIPWLKDLAKRCTGDALKRMLRLLHRVDAGVDVFLPYLHSRDKGIRAIALEALGKRGVREAIIAAREIVEKNERFDALVRASLRVLRRFGMRDDKLAPRYIQIVRDKRYSPSTRMLAVALLRDSGVEEEVEGLFQLMVDQNEAPSVKKAIARALVVLHPETLFRL